MELKFLFIRDTSRSYHKGNTSASHGIKDEGLVGIDCESGLQERGEEFWEEEFGCGEANETGTTEIGVVAMVLETRDD